jgi:hypothetical protein
MGFSFFGLLADGESTTDIGVISLGLFSDNSLLNYLFSFAKSSI